MGYYFIIIGIILIIYSLNRKNIKNSRRKRRR